MEWKELGQKVIGLGLPLLGGAIAGPAGSTVGNMVANVLGCAPDADTIGQSLDENPDKAALQITLRKLEMDHQLELERLVIQNALEVNKTIRQEVKSEHSYVRNMRPTFGYLIAGSIAYMIAIGGYAVIVDPEALTMYARFVEAVDLPLTTATAVLGVYVKKRSDDKSVDRGHAPTSLIGSLMNRK